MARVLILYLMRNSGHHAAARALEAAFRRADPGGTVQCLDLLQATHPAWSVLLQKTYLGIVRRTPELWDRLYDNARLERVTRRLRRLLQGGRHPRVRLLMARGPDIVVCTQAHPLGVVLGCIGAGARPPPALWGVLTDFLPHRFWVYPGACRYVAPNESAAERLVALGVDRARIRVHGIPIHPDYAAPLPRRVGDPPRVLVMGGGRGLGVRYRTIRHLDRANAAFQIEVVAGTNRMLRNLLRLRQGAFRHPLRVHGFCRRMPARYRRADLLVSKAGGATCAEALAMGVPLVIVRPLPGQEQGNMEFMVRHGAAVHVPRERDLGAAVDMLLTNPALLAMMRRKAADLARPEAALQIVRCMLGS